ncbi:RxLR effector protein [Phytophthora megakarya]|uniref:RxLR effector protein n=1 Tax=Phytophthora megakarya TaxID=4795 RepID=A0A225W8Z4_9STRA|nr:RxLR effector protein [Phytophthora megakarya]
MRLQYIMLMAIATLVTSNGVVSGVPVVRATEDVQLWKAADANLINPVNTEHVQPKRKRFLRTGDTKTTDYVYDPTKKKVFIEDKLHKSLTNPKKAKKLYKRWYKRGYSVKLVTRTLNQGANKDVVDVYDELAKGYAAYFKKKSS